MNAPITTETRWRGSLHRFVPPSGLNRVQKKSENNSCNTQRWVYGGDMKTTTQTTSVRKEQVADWQKNGYAVSENQLPAEQNPLGLVAMEKQVPWNAMLRGNNQWWKL